MTLFRSSVLTVVLAVSLAAAGAASASPLIGTSWDGSYPGTLADIANCTDFSFGMSQFAAGQYQITWGGAYTAWRDLTTIGYNDGRQTTLFNPGSIATGTSVTFTANGTWDLFANTPSLSNASSTGAQWAFDQTGANEWMWGLEDIQLGQADGDWQDAFGTLKLIAPATVVSSEITQPTPAPTPTPTPDPSGTNGRSTSISTPPGGQIDPLVYALSDQPFSPGLPVAALDVVPEPSTLILFATGLGLALRRRFRA